jgi:subtilase family serine protease
VNSISYGVAEVLVDKYLGKGYLARADFEFRKLALRGISVLIASADNGAGDLGTFIIYPN